MELGGLKKEEARILIDHDEFVFVAYRSPEQAELTVTESVSGPGSLQIQKQIQFKKNGAELFRYELKNFSVNAAVKKSTGLDPTKAPTNEEIREWVELVR